MVLVVHFEGRPGKAWHPVLADILGANIAAAQREDKVLLEGV